MISFNRIKLVRIYLCTKLNFILSIFKMGGSIYKIWKQKNCFVYIHERIFWIGNVIGVRSWKLVIFDKIWNGWYVLITIDLMKNPVSITSCYHSPGSDCCRCLHISVSPPSCSFVHFGFSWVFFEIEESSFRSQLI